MALSDTWLRANNGKNQKKGFVRTDRDGLSIRVSPRGKIVFQMRYRFNGKQDRVSLGSYPFMSLKDARAETVRLRTKLEEGNCPKLVKQLAKQEIVGAVSIKELFMQWYKAYCIKNKKGHKEILRSFELYVFPKIGNLPAEKITIHEWLHVLEEVADLVPGTAHRILTNAKQMLKWSVNRRLIAENLLRDINASEDLSIKNNVGDRFFDDEEIRLFWKAVTESKMAHKNKLFVKLCLVFGCRNGELRLSKKEHFDFDRKVWTVPPENHKLGKKTNKPLLL